jgi:hypothetical protein
MTQKQDFKWKATTPFQDSGENSAVDKFDRVFLKSVDLAFSMLGESSSQAIYQYLEKRLGIDREDLSKAIDEFSRALDEIFGVASPLIETRIMYLLHIEIPEFNFSSSNANLSFTDYVEKLRVSL